MSNQRSAIRDRLSTVDGRRSAFGGRWPAVGGSLSAVRFRRPAGRGFTLVELMVVFAVIAILVAVIGYASRGIMGDAKVKQTKAMMESLKLAMSEYTATGKKLPVPPTYLKSTGPDTYSVLPPSGGNWGQPEERVDYYRQQRSGTPLTIPPSDETNALGQIWAVGQANVSPPHASNGLRMYGIQALYYRLMSEPGSRQVLNKLGSEYTTQASKILPQAGDFVLGSGVETMFSREALAIVDAWGQPLHYVRSSVENNNQPYVQSAGSDGIFSTGDDVFSFER